MKLICKPWFGLGILGIVALLLATPQDALAHAKLKKSVPADKVELTESPKQIELWFDELLDDKFNSIAVYSAADTNEKERKNLTDGDAKVDENDRTHLTVKLKTLIPGDYVVEWRVLSRDGHSAPGRFTFKVKTIK